MKALKTLGVLAVTALAVVSAGCGGGASSSSAPAVDHAGMQMGTGAVLGATATRGGVASPAADLRVTLDRLLGEHALLAIEATQRGFDGGKDFPALAKQLDRNSVAISKAIGSVYGAAAGRQFLDGKFLWRDHIRFFVDYTVATAKHDTAAQKKAVANLMTYVGAQATFFAKATGLSKEALRNDLTAHILQLKGQLDAYAKGNYAQSYSLSRAAYAHMYMTGDLLAGAIAKQRNLSSDGASSKAVTLRITLDRLLGEHALLATYATQSGLRGGKNFPALAKSLDANSVDISKAIASVYGPAAGKQFLNGSLLWRDHIRFFVDYTVATAKHDTAGQKKAVANLTSYVRTQAAFFAKATGLPAKTLRDDLTAHVLQLKGVVDQTAAKRYGAAYSLVDGAYAHMFMTGDALAGAIAKQKGY